MGRCMSAPHHLKQDFLSPVSSCLWSLQLGISWNTWRAPGSHPIESTCWPSKRMQLPGWGFFFEWSCAIISFSSEQRLKCRASTGLRERFGLFLFLLVLADAIHRLCGWIHHGNLAMKSFSAWFRLKLNLASAMTLFNQNETSGMEIFFLGAFV